MTTYTVTAHGVQDYRVHREDQPVSATSMRYWTARDALDSADRLNADPELCAALDAIPVRKTSAEARLLTPCLTFQLAELREWDQLQSVIHNVQDEARDALRGVAYAGGVRYLPTRMEET